MVLMSVVGELGSQPSYGMLTESGKTLTLTYNQEDNLLDGKLAWKNYMKKNRRVFSNYELFGIPHTRIKSLGDLENMRDGFVAADELWLWLDARTSSKQMNKVSSDLLLKSRKRGLTLAFTAQHQSQIDARIRKSQMSLSEAM